MRERASTPAPLPAVALGPPAKPKAPARPHAADLARAAHYARAEKAGATRRAYAIDFRIFQAWCQGHGAVALPASADTLAAFLAAEADRNMRPSTLGRRVAAIAYMHKLSGLPVPSDAEMVRLTLRGIRRVLGTAACKKAPATAEHVIAMAPSPDGSLSALRDRAVILLGFAGAFRRSELVALDWEDIEQVAEGLRITLRRGKTDQEAKGVTVAVLRGAIACPVAALLTWSEVATISTGPVFRPIGKGGKLKTTRLTDRSVANIVKAHATRIGLEAANFSGHSLRAGFLTSAAKSGASLLKMRDVSRHRSLDTLSGYVRDAEVFRNHAGEGLL